MKILFIAAVLFIFTFVTDAKEMPEKTIKERSESIYRDLYNMSKSEMEEDEKELRAQSSITIPGMFKWRKGQYSGLHSVPWLYSYGYDNSKHFESYELLPWQLIQWGEVDGSSFFSSPVCSSFNSKNPEGFGDSGFSNLLFGHMHTKEKNGVEASVTRVRWLYNYDMTKSEKSHSKKRSFINLLNKKVLSIESTMTDESVSFVGPLVNWQRKGQDSGFEFNPLFAHHSKGDESHLTISPLFTRFVSTEEGTEMHFDGTKLWPLFYKSDYAEEYDVLWPLASFKVNKDDTLDIEFGGGYLYKRTAEETSVGTSYIYSYMSKKDNKKVRLAFIYDYEKNKDKEKMLIATGLLYKNEKTSYSEETLVAFGALYKNEKTSYSEKTKMAFGVLYDFDKYKEKEKTVIGTAFLYESNKSKGSEESKA